MTIPAASSSTIPNQGEDQMDSIDLHNNNNSNNNNNNSVPNSSVFLALEDAGGTTTTTSEEEQDVEEETKTSQCCKKLAVGLVLLAFIIFVIVDSLTNQYIKNGLLAFLEWIEGHPFIGVLSFILVYFVATIFFVPGSVLTLGAGFVFSASFDSLWIGVLLGTLAVFVGASLGATASFLLGRYLFRDGFVQKLTEKYKVFWAIDKSMEDKGLRIMVLLRLSPIVPFNALNYLAGVTAIRFWDYVLACLGMLPGTLLYVFFGASAGSLAEIGGGDDETESNKAVTISVVVVGIVFGVAAVALSSYYAKQELNKVLEKEDETNDGTNNNEPNEGTTADPSNNMDSMEENVVSGKSSGAIAEAV